MSTLDDTTLILQFINGHPTLAANQTLRVETAFNTLQLLAKRGGLLATLQQIDNIPTVLVRQGSDYCHLIRHILLENHFLPQGVGQHSEFVQYQKQNIPAGYTLHCTEARVLWKEWWTATRNRNPNSIDPDLLVFTRNTWYPIREIASIHGNLFVKTLVTELVFEVYDEVLWLNRPSDQPVKPKVTTFRHQSFIPVNSRAVSLGRQPTLEQSREPIAPNSATSPQKLAYSRTKRTYDLLRDRLDTPIGSRLDTPSVRPDLQDMLKMHQGKLYITTAIGEVVVEGENLKFWVNQTQDPAQKSLTSLQQ
jgi:hypothetical protein